jgi:hypothetical protein
MRITADGLDPDDSYWSNWIGTVYGPVKTVANDQGLPIIGFHSRFDPKSGVASIGLLGASESDPRNAATPAIATNTPLDPGPLNSDPIDSIKPKSPVPSKRDREKAMEAVERNYRDSLASVRSIREFRRIAQRMIDDGQTDPDDLLFQYARFEKVRELGIWFGDAKTAIDGLQAIEERFEIEFWDEALETIEDAELKANTETQDDFKQTMDSLVDRAINDQQFGPAGKLIASATLMAKRARDSAAQDKYKNLRKQVVELDKLAEQAKKARNALAADPNDADANLIQGDFLFVVADDSDAAFEFWEKSSVSDLKDLVKKENSVDKQDGSQLLGLATEWEKLGQDNRSVRDRKFLERARIHYQAAYRLLAGLDRQSALSKIKELDQILN